MTARMFRRLALGLPGVVEAAHMGHPDFRANGKIFATLQNDQRGMVKLARDQQSRFVAEHPDTFALQAGAWGRQGCTRVRLPRAEAEVVGEALTLAWQNVRASSGRRARSAR